MNHSFALDIIVFAVIAVVLYIRLRKVLGERTDQDPPPIDPSVLLKPKQAVADKIVTENSDVIDHDATPAAASPTWTQDMPNYQWVLNATAHHRLLPLAAVDPNFHPRTFLGGARKAYEMIIVAYAKGDLNTLENLLSPSLFATFKEQITDRQKNGETREIVLFDLSQAVLSDARLDGTMAYVTVDFTSDQSIAVRDAQGQSVDGLDGSRRMLKDRWVFSNDLKDNETLWRLMETDGLDD